MSKPSVFIIFLTVFIDLIGFGIVLPLIPNFSRNFAAPEWFCGIIMASFSAMQFLCAPFWGRLSDRIGRRPVILVGLAGSTLSYVVFALAFGLPEELKDYVLWVVLGSRILAGIMGANISVAQAYMADITPPEKRSKGMGLIGMAFGLGFILGPGLAALALSFFGLSGPGWFAAGISGFAFVFALAKLAESNANHVGRSEQRPHFQQIVHVLGMPQVGLLVMLFFLASFCFTTFENTLGWLVQDNFGLDTTKAEGLRTVSYLFAFAGFVGAMVQGGAIGRLVKMFGEKKLVVMSLVLTGASLVPLPYARAWWPFIAVLGGLAVGSSLARAPIFGMISILAPTKEQGATIAVAQSAGALARILGPIFAGVCYGVRAELPYLICAGVSILAASIALVKLREIKHEEEATASPLEASSE